MTTTTEATPTAPAIETAVAPDAADSVTRTDAEGTFVLVNGVRIPVNAEGVVVLDGTAGEAAYQTLMALETAIDALVSQRDTQKDTIKALMGNHAIATLRGEPVVDWTWGSQTTVNGALLKALSNAIWTRCSRTTSRRSFNLKKKARKPA